MGIRSAVALLLLVASVRAQQTVNAPDGNTFVCPTQETGTVAYVHYCPQQAQDGGALAGVSAIMTYANAPTSYQSANGGILLICGYPAVASGSSAYICQYTAGNGAPLSLNANSDARCPAPITTIPQPSPGVNYKRDQVNTFTKRLSTATPFTCPRRVAQDGTVYLTSEQISIGNRGGSTGTIYDCVWTHPQGGDSLRCSYNSDPSQGPVVTANYGTSLCPTTLCNAVMTGSNNMRRRGIFVEGGEDIAKRQVKTSDLRSRAKAKKAKRARRVRSE